MPTKQGELRERAKQFALRIIRMDRALPRTEEARVIGRQLLRAGTSMLRGAPSRPDALRRQRRLQGC